jgi:hypothetical protein
MNISPNGLITNAGQLAATDTSTMADIVNGAQLGYGPNLPQIDGATPLVLSPIVPIVTHIPTMLANVQYAPEILKALVERHAKEISGIDFGYQLESSSTPVGQDGQELHMPTNSKRTQVNPTFTWQEITGNLVWNFIKNWIEMIKQPDTQASSLTAIDLGDPMLPMLMSSFTMDIIFIQFDPTFRPENIIDAFFVTNMWPTETGMIGAKRQIGHSEMVDRTIAFNGVLQHNRNTKVAGQIIADALGLHRSNYDFAVPITTSVDPALSGMGLDYETQQNLATFSDLDTGASPNGNIA